MINTFTIFYMYIFNYIYFNICFNLSVSYKPPCKNDYYIKNINYEHPIFLRMILVIYYKFYSSNDFNRIIIFF
jgi:hypothetical protein